MKHPEAFRRYVIRLAREFRDWASHSEYNLSFIFSFEPDPDEGDNDHNATTRASINVDSTYLYATIKVYPSLFEQWQDGNYKAVARDVLHEICHLVTEPIADLAMYDAAPSQRGPWRRIIERQTQRTANMAEWGLEAKNRNWFCPKPGEFAPEKKKGKR